MARKLRERNAQAGSGSLFDFDGDSPVDYGAILARCAGDEGEVLELDAPAASQIRLAPEIVPSAFLDRARKRRALPGDCLGDQLYELYHRRMEKEEKKMFNRDREKVCSEADRMALQLEQLLQNDWARHLPHITKVADARDAHELKLKRELTIGTLRSLLSRFKEWKATEDRVAGRSRLAHRAPQGVQLYTKLTKSEYFDESSTDSDEDDMTVDQIRRNRSRKNSKYAPTIRIRFSNHSLVAEPFQNPRIETYE